MLGLVAAAIDFFKLSKPNSTTRVDLNAAPERIKPNLPPPGSSHLITTATRSGEPFTRLQIRGLLKQWQDTTAVIQTNQQTVEVVFNQQLQYACEPPVLPTESGEYVVPVDRANINLLFRDDYGSPRPLTEIQQQTPLDTPVLVLATQHPNGLIKGYVLVVFNCPKDL